MADNIEFRFINPLGVEDWSKEISKVTQIFLNGKELVDILKEIEYQFAEKEGHPDLAGGYGHLTPNELLSNLKYSKEDPDYEAELLCCSDCGISGCWSILVHIKYDENYVYWNDFSHNHRDWKYNLSFKFVKSQYEEQLKKLSDNI